MDYPPTPPSFPGANDDDGGDGVAASRAPNPGNNSALEQDSNIPRGWKPSVEKPLPVVRCTGTVRNGDRTGERCGRWSIMGHDKCLVHGGHLPNVQKAAQKKVEAARMRLIDDADKAVDTLFELIMVGTADNVRLGASKEILDRAGIRGGVEMKVEVEHTVAPSESIRDRLNDMAKRLAPKPVEPEPEDLGEVLDEPAEQP